MIPYPKVNLMKFVLPKVYVVAIKAREILTAKVTTIEISHMVKLRISCFSHPMHERQLIHTNVINTLFFIGKYKSEI